ncbi:MAG: hypothetical protein LUG46_00570 [Erysipelotrichaceae bacterium]|nr:hypothetical protein [Erysipelotrichaceae bacterium]
MNKQYESIAREVIFDLSDENKDIMLEEPEYWKYHFSLGLYIRNKYIYGKMEDVDADDVSGEILECIIEILKNEYQC